MRKKRQTGKPLEREGNREKPRHGADREEGRKTNRRKSENSEEQADYLRLINSMTSQDLRRINPDDNQRFLVFSSVNNSKPVINKSGYFIGEIENGYLLFLVDCAGERSLDGVMTSIVYVLLRRIVFVERRAHPEEIMEQLNLSLKDAFEAQAGLAWIKEKIHVSVCRVNTKEETLVVSGPGVSVLLSDGASVIDLFDEERGVASAEKGAVVRFSTRTVTIREGDRLYLVNHGISHPKKGNPAQKPVLDLLKAYLNRNASKSIKEQEREVSQLIPALVGDETTSTECLMVGFEVKKVSFQDRRKNRGDRRKNISNQKQMEVMYNISKDLNDILYIKTETPYCKIHYQSEERASHILRTTFQSIEFHFSESNLLRVHRRYLINPKAVITVFRDKREFKVLLKGETRNITIPVGRSYNNVLKERFPRLFH